MSGLKAVVADGLRDGVALLAASHRDDHEAWRVLIRNANGRATAACLAVLLDEVLAASGWDTTEEFITTWQERLRGLDEGRPA